MSKTILVVDDSSTVRNLVAATLKDHGFDVIEASDGVEALAKLNGEEKIHLVVCDVNMPKMDGLAFVDKMKKKPEYKFVPVIMLTNQGSDAMKDQGRVAGANAWIIKPFHPDKFLAGVRKLLMM